MNARHRRPSLRRSLVVLLPVVLLSSLIPFASVSAAVTVTGAAGGGAISADTNSAGGSGVYTALTGPSITEGTAGELAAGGSIDLLAPAGFEFAPASASAAPGGPGCFGMTLGAVTTSSTTVTIPITAPSTLPCVISVSGLGVRPTSGSPLATGTITNTGTRGPGGSSNYGDLAEIVGAPVLSVTSGAIGNTTGGMTLTSSPSFHAGDISGNDRAGDSILLGIKAGTGSAGAVLTCDANPVSATAGGLAAFTGCRIDKAGAGYVLTASTGAASVDTNEFDITVGPPANLVFTAYPGTPSTRTLAPQPTVAVVDAGGQSHRGGRQHRGDAGDQRRPGDIHVHRRVEQDGNGRQRVVRRLHPDHRRHLLVDRNVLARSDPDHGPVVHHTLQHGPEARVLLGNRSRLPLDPADDLQRNALQRATHDQASGRHWQHDRG